MWKHIVDAVTESRPKFNDHLLLKFRKDKLAEAPAAVDAIFRETQKLFDNRFDADVSEDKIHYQGYEVMSPEDRLKNVAMYKGNRIELGYTTARLYTYKFEFAGQIKEAHPEIPFLYNNRILNNGTETYPIFPIIEKGCLNVIGDKVTISVMMNVLVFWRQKKDTFQVKTLSGSTFYAIVVKTRLHNGKDAGRAPLLAYLLVKYGLQETLERFGYGQDITIVSEKDIIDTPDVDYVGIGNECYLKFNNQLLKQQQFTRLVVSLVFIYSKYDRFELADLLKPAYYVIVLGKFIFTKPTDPRQLPTRVAEHLAFCDHMLDVPHMIQLRSINVNVGDLYELSHAVLNNIDTWIRTYNPVDLHKKKVASLELLLAKYTTQIFKPVFGMVSKGARGIRPDNVGMLTSKASKGISAYIYNQMFFNKTDRANDSWLLSIGLNRLRSENNLDTNSTNNRKKGGGRIPIQTVLCHDSHISVESIMVIPSSTPIISGTINPYLKIDADGNIIKKPIDKLADGAFKL